MDILPNDPGIKKIDIGHTYVKDFCKPPFISTFRAILYHRGLSKLAKMLAFVLLDSPLKLDQNFSIFARKMKITNASMSKARRELQRAKVIIIPAKIKEIGQK